MKFVVWLGLLGDYYMSGVLATTTTSDITNTIKTYYDRILLETLEPTLRFYQFAEKKPVPRGEGVSVIWNRVVGFDLGRILTEGQGGTLSAGRNLSTVKVSAIVNQYGDWCPISDIADWASIMDVGKAAVERLAEQMAKTIDRVIANEIVNHVSSTTSYLHNKFKTSTEVTDYWGMTSTVSSGIMTVSAANVIAVSDVKDVIFGLKSLNVKPYSGNDYMAIMPTEVASDFVEDSTFINFHQYVEKGIDTLYNGELGKVYGCRIVDAPTGPAKRGSNSGGTASTIAYGTVIFGKGFYGCVEFPEKQETYFVDGASKSDPLNQTKVYGWKANMAAKVLNPSCGMVLWTGAHNTTTAYAESAGSGLRHEDPSSY